MTASSAASPPSPEPSARADTAGAHRMRRDVIMPARSLRLLHRGPVIVAAVLPAVLGGLPDYPGRPGDDGHPC